MKNICDSRCPAQQECSAFSGLAVQKLPVSVRPRIGDFESVRDHALGYENEAIVRRLARDFEFPEAEARSIFKDTVRFLTMCGTLHGPFAPSSRIDDGWHTFLLYTEDYSKFCFEFFGEFIHHRPRGDDERDSEGIIPRTKAAAKFMFGELSSNWVYNAAGQDCCSDCPCESCSASTNCQN